ncbi:hypothetical protein FRC06_010758 [Ceratobasidium sp. 370]|nr:hypothetical protein FRC06_010758 [Ceratobasidium sp. 370]
MAAEGQNDIYMGELQDAGHCLWVLPNVVDRQALVPSRHPLIFSLHQIVCLTSPDLSDFKCLLNHLPFQKARLDIFHRDLPPVLKTIRTPDHQNALVKMRRIVQYRRSTSVAAPPPLRIYLKHPRQWQDIPQTWLP